MLTGSQPTSAGNPLVPHPGLLPETMSVNVAAPAEEYSNGLRKPSLGFPTARSLSLMRAIILANVGVAILVPNADS